MTENTEQQRKAGLQKNVYEVFEGVSIQDQGDPPKKKDLGPENPMVTASTLGLLREQRAALKASDSRQSSGISRGQKITVAIAILICLSFVAYYLTTHEAPPLVLVVPLFILYVIGASLGALHTHRVAKTRQSQTSQSDKEPASESNI